MSGFEMTRLFFQPEAIVFSPLIISGMLYKSQSCDLSISCKFHFHPVVLYFSSILFRIIALDVYLMSIANTLKNFSFKSLENANSYIKLTYAPFDLHVVCHLTLQNRIDLFTFTDRLLERVSSLFILPGPAHSLLNLFPQFPYRQPLSTFYHHSGIKPVFKIFSLISTSLAVCPIS